MTMMVMISAPAEPKPKFRFLIPKVYRYCVIVVVEPAGPPPVRMLTLSNRRNESIVRRSRQRKSFPIPMKRGLPKMRLREGNASASG